MYLERTLLIRALIVIPFLASPLRASSKSAVNLVLKEALYLSFFFVAFNKKAHPCLLEIEKKVAMENCGATFNFSRNS